MRRSIIESLFPGAVIGALFGALVGIGLVVREEVDRNAAEQAKLDTLYEEMVGDSNSVMTGLREVTEQMHALCVEVAVAKGIHPEYCEVNDE